MIKIVNHNQKIVVAMSGGVDSSVAASMLKEQGFDVIGIFLKFWHEPKCADARENICCSKEAADSARAVADKLKIPFYVLDASKEFKREVVDYYIKEYDSGRTPNPCVMCNKFIKFGWLINKAKELGANFLATGHYARLQREFSISNFQFPKNSQISNNKFQMKLLKGKDQKKDQSYFLWQLDKDQLKHVLFPVGDCTKEEVRKLARKFNLPTAEKKESQNVCFVPDGDNQSFLKRHTNKLIKSGNIVDLKGNILGTHKGLIGYTVGQRHGLEGVQLVSLASGFRKVYVIKLNVDKNELVVGGEQDLYKNELIAGNINLINPRVAYQSGITTKIRYGCLESKCKISKMAPDKIKIIFDHPQRAITPGQSIVFYKKDELIGGGIIQ